MTYQKVILKLKFHQNFHCIVLINNINLKLEHLKYGDSHFEHWSCFFFFMSSMTLSVYPWPFLKQMTNVIYFFLSLSTPSHPLILNLLPQHPYIIVLVFIVSILHQKSHCLLSCFPFLWCDQIILIFTFLISSVFPLVFYCLWVLSIALLIMVTLMWEKTSKTTLWI